MLRAPAGPALLLHEQIIQLGWTAGPDPQPRHSFAQPLPLWPTASWSGRLRTAQAGHWWVFDTGTRSCWRREASPAFIHALAGPGGKPYSVRATIRLPDGRLLVGSYGAGILTQARDSPLAPLRPWKRAVTNGTKAGFTPVSALVYTVNVTPTGAAPVTMTVNVAANAASDGVGNGNSAAPAFTLTHRLLPAISSFTPGTGAVGTSVTITGTNLSSATAAAVNGTVGTITGTPTPTSLTFTVGAGSTTGLVSVTTPAGTASSAISATSFTVCQPLAVAQDVTLALDASGAATLLVSQVNNVREADCGAALLLALSVSPSTYFLRDEQLPATVRVLYYRLRQVDTDGTFSYSPVRVVTRSGTGAVLALFPNPARWAATLTGTLPGAVVRYSMQSAGR